MASARDRLDDLLGHFWPSSERHARDTGASLTDRPVHPDLIEDLEKLREAVFLLADRVDGRPSFERDQRVRVDLRGFENMPPSMEADEVEAVVSEVSYVSGIAILWHEPINNYIRYVPLERLTPL